jgi:hypothetical protein
VIWAELVDVQAKRGASRELSLWLCKRSAAHHLCGMGNRAADPLELQCEACRRCVVCGKSGSFVYSSKEFRLLPNELSLWVYKRAKHVISVDGQAHQLTSECSRPSHSPLRLQYGSKISTIQSPAEGMPRGYVNSGEEFGLLPKHFAQF